MKSAVRQLWKYSKVRVYGSTPQELCLPSSDMDVAIFVSHSGPELTILMELHEHLEALDWTKTCRLITARVPIIRIEDEESGLWVDISTNKTEGL